MSTNNSIRPSCRDKKVSALAVTKSGYPVVHEKHGMVQFRAHLGNGAYKVRLKEGEEVVADAEELRPLDAADWQNEETARLYREIIQSGPFIKSYVRLHPLRDLLGFRSVSVLEFLHNWQVLHGNQPEFYCNLSKMCDETRVSVPSLKRIIKVLVDKKILVVRRKSGEHNRYTLLWAEIDDLIQIAERKWQRKKRKRKSS